MVLDEVTNWSLIAELLYENLEKRKTGTLSSIQDLGFESLRYSIFMNMAPVNGK